MIRIGASVCGLVWLTSSGKWKPPLVVFRFLSNNLLCSFYHQTVESEKFEASPILFGDFMKMGADPSDRIYEELVDVAKVKNLLTDVRCR